MPTVRDDTQLELTDNLFHNLVTGLNMIKEASSVGGIRVHFTADDDHFIVGPYSELFPYVESHRLEALGFKPPKKGGIDVWVFDTSALRQRRSRR